MKDNALIIENICNDLLTNKLCIQNKKLFYLLYKYLNPDINIKFNEDKKEIKLNEKKLSPDIVKINYYDINSKVNKMINIDTHFELINKNIISLFIKDNFSTNEATYDIINDYILIHYPKGMHENSQFITLIKKYKKESIFNVEYILIYYSDEDRIKHIKLIKQYLSNYLKYISLINNNAPILNDNFEIIGVIIKNDTFINKNSNKYCIKKYNPFEIKYNEEKENNDKLTNKIEELKDLLNKEKNINLDLNNKIKEITNNYLNKESLLKEEISKSSNLKIKNDELIKESKNIKLNVNDLENKINKFKNKFLLAKNIKFDLEKKK